MDESDDEIYPEQKLVVNEEKVINKTNNVINQQNTVMVHPNIFKDTVEFIPEPDKLKIYLLNNNCPDNYIPLEIDHPMPDNEVELMLLLNYLANEDNIVTLRVSIRTNDENKPEQYLDIEDSEYFEEKDKKWLVSINGKYDSLTKHIENYTRVNQSDFIVLQIQ